MRKKDSNLFGLLKPFGLCLMLLALGATRLHADLNTSAEQNIHKWQALVINSHSLESEITGGAIAALTLTESQDQKVTVLVYKYKVPDTTAREFMKDTHLKRIHHKGNVLFTKQGLLTKTSTQQNQNLEPGRSFIEFQSKTSADEPGFHSSLLAVRKAQTLYVFDYSDHRQNYFKNINMIHDLWQNPDLLSLLPQF